MDVANKKINFWNCFHCHISSHFSFNILRTLIWHEVTNCLQYLVSRSSYSSKMILATRLLNFSNQERTTVFGVSRWHVVVFLLVYYLAQSLFILFFILNILTFGLFCLIILVSHLSCCLAFISSFFSQNWPHSQSTTQSAFIIWLWQTCFISKSKIQSYLCKRKIWLLEKYAPNVVFFLQLGNAPLVYPVHLNASHHTHS